MANKLDALRKCQKLLVAQVDREKGVWRREWVERSWGVDAVKQAIRDGVIKEIVLKRPHPVYTHKEDKTDAVYTEKWDKSRPHWF